MISKSIVDLYFLQNVKSRSAKELALASYCAPLIKLYERPVILILYETQVTTYCLTFYPVRSVVDTSCIRRGEWNWTV